MDNYIEAFSSGIYVFVKEAHVIKVKAGFEKYDVWGDKIPKEKIISRIIEAPLIPSKSKGKQKQETYRVPVCDFLYAFNSKFQREKIYKDDDKCLKIAEFFYDKWEGKNDLCKNHDDKNLETCKSCELSIIELQKAIPWEDSDFYYEKLFIWILLNKKEWNRPKLYFISLIRFLILNACSSIERLLANKIMDYNDFIGIENTLTSTVERYASPICDILISGLSTELDDSYDRLGITREKQIKLRKDQNLRVWFDEVSNKKESLTDFLQKTILGAKTFHSQLNGLVYSLLLDIWRGEDDWDPDSIRCSNWQKWVQNIELWRASSATSKPLEPNVKPVHKGNVLCCSTPVSYQLQPAGNEANSKNKSLSFYPALLWPTQHCPNCNKLMSGGVLKPSIWLQGERIQTITKTCQKSRIKLDSWKCGTCDSLECKCENCVTENGKDCIKCSLCKACACASGNCKCDDKAKCACNKCEMSFFSSKKKADSHIYILTKGIQNIPCPLSGFHTTDGQGKGTGRTSEVFIDVENFSIGMDGLLATTNTYKDLCKLLVKCGFKKDQFEPLLQIKVKEYSQILIDIKDHLPNSNSSHKNLFKNLEKAINVTSINSTKTLFNAYKALCNVISTLGEVLEDLCKNLYKLTSNNSLNMNQYERSLLHTKVRQCLQILTANMHRLPIADSILCPLYNNLIIAQNNLIGSTEDLFNDFKALHKDILILRELSEDIEIGSIPIFHKR